MKNTSNLSRSLFFQNIQNGKTSNHQNGKRNSLSEKARRIVTVSSFILLMTMTFAVSGQDLQPEEGKGLVVFYRTKKFSGGAIKFSVKDSEKITDSLPTERLLKFRWNRENTYFGPKLYLRMQLHLILKKVRFIMLREP